MGLVSAAVRADTAGLYRVVCDAYHAALERLVELFPSIHFAWGFVPGEKNIADGGSRGATAALTKQAIGECIESVRWIAEEERGRQRVRREWMV